MKLLLVEDNKKLVEKMSEYLISENFVVDIAFNGVEGLEKIYIGEYDCIVLDINMPRMNGLDTCKKIRSEGINTPILFLTALSDKVTTIKGLNLGADEYLTKPFDLDILIAHINALTRRFKNNKTKLVRIGSVKIDIKSHEVYKNEKLIQLSPREYELLKYLSLNIDKIVSVTEITENVWHDYDRLMFSRTVDVHIAYLRKKLGKDLIKTVKGSGYMIKENQKI